MSTDPSPPSVFRPGAVSYLHLPAPDPAASAAFYAAVFGWQTEVQDAQSARFADGSGHVIGHFMAEQPVSGAAGPRPYIYVENIATTLAAVRGAGGEVTLEPYSEGSLLVATFRDPAGNIIGVWQQT
jgi:uncharacterized protein